MRRLIGRLAIVLVLGCTLTSCLSAPWDAAKSKPLAPGSPVFAIDSAPFITEWVALEPIPYASGHESEAFGTDYLTSLGGEAKAVLTAKSQLAGRDSTMGEWAADTYTPRIKAGVNFIDLVRPDRSTLYQVSYAFAYIQSPREQTRTVFFGSDDWAKVWVNGELVNKTAAGQGRTCYARNDMFTIHLHRGLNTVLVKDGNIGGDWRFVFEIPSVQETEKISTERARRDAIESFQEVEIVPKEYHSYVFFPGEFPTIQWSNPERVKAVWGDVSQTVRWFDGQGREVKKADGPGRYVAYLEATTKDGLKIRRALTLFCSPEGWRYWDQREEGIPVQNPPKPISPTAWAEHAAQVDDFTAGAFRHQLAYDEAGAVLLSGLWEAKPLGRLANCLESPDEADRQFQLNLKRNLLGVEHRYAPLKSIAKTANPEAKTLRPGTPAEAGFKPDAVERIRAACLDWAGSTTEPFTALVARHGVVIFHESFGATPERPVDDDTQYPLASITKTLCALTFAQFMDQGLINVDDPVGKILPDFPTTGEHVLTWRHCLTHTSSLHGHGEWGGMNNPWLENVIANSVESLHPAGEITYNGMGYDLAGKGMEMVSGDTYDRLLNERLFAPLQISERPVPDLAFGVRMTAEELARVGQMMLNRGSYGTTQFMRPETFDKMLPRPVAESIPNMIDKEYVWGLGLMVATIPHPERGRNGVADDAIVLGPHTFGHGAASSTVLRVDPDNGLVITMGRFNAGNNYDAHLSAFMKVIEECLN